MFENCYIGVIRFSVIDEDGKKKIGRGIFSSDEPITDEYKEKMITKDLILLYSGLGRTAISSTYKEISKEEYEKYIGRKELDPNELFQEAIRQTERYYMARNIRCNYSIRFYCRIASTFDNLRDESLPYNEQWQSILKKDIER